MPRESKAARGERVSRLLGRLGELYPDAHCELHYRTPLELLVATILSAQTTDQQVNKVTPDLFAAYRCAADYACAPRAELEERLKSIGLFRNKARNIQACCQTLVERHGGEVPRSMDDLIQLAGVGRKTANVVLGNAFGVNAGIVVDTHVARLAQRLGLSRERQPEKIELELQSIVPRQTWTLFSHWLIWHGRRCCSARQPACSRCGLAGDCPSACEQS